MASTSNTTRDQSNHMEVIREFLKSDLSDVGALEMTKAILGLPLKDLVSTVGKMDTKNRTEFLDKVCYGPLLFESFGPLLLQRRMVFST